jgi:hypothetical protein
MCSSLSVKGFLYLPPPGTTFLNLWMSQKVNGRAITKITKARVPGSETCELKLAERLDTVDVGKVNTFWFYFFGAFFPGAPGRLINPAFIISYWLTKSCQKGMNKPLSKSSTQKSQR